MIRNSFQPGIGSDKGTQSESLGEKFQEAVSDAKPKYKQKVDKPNSSGTGHKPVVVADASKYHWNKLNLDKSTAKRLGYPNAKNTAPPRKTSPPKTNGGNLSGALGRSVTFVALGLGISEALNKLAGQPPTLKLQQALGTDGDLAITIYGKKYKGNEAKPGSAYFTKGIGGKRLDVKVTVTDDGIVFDPDILRQEYGKELPKELQTSASSSDKPEDPNKQQEGFAVEIRTEEESHLVTTMRAQGKTSSEIQDAINGLRKKKGTDDKSHPFKPAPKNYDYETVFIPRPGAFKDIVVSEKNKAHDGQLMGTFSEKTGDFIIGFYNSPGKKVGREMISQAIEAIGPSRVKTVSASFFMNEKMRNDLIEKYGKTNSTIYESNRSKGMTQEEAIWATPLGQAMKDLGFSSLKVKPGGGPRMVFGYK